MTAKRTGEMVGGRLIRRSSEAVSHLADCVQSVKTWRNRAILLRKRFLFCGGKE